eukprot:9198349-Pyramimonas_sp.AAC.1
MAAMELSHFKMPAPLEQTYVRGLKSFKEHFADENGEYTLGALCGGSDIMRIAVSELELLWKRKYDIDVSFPLVFTAEVDPKKQSFLKVESSATHIFGDVADLLSVRAPCARTGNQGVVPFAGGMFAGFPCQDRSAQNPNAANMVGCVQKEEGRTGGVLSTIAAICKQNAPTFIILENVTQLLQKTESGISDVAYIAKKFATIYDDCQEPGYYSIDRTIDAMDYGSRNARERLYMAKIRFCAGADEKEMQSIFD